jgi:AcrR family transcriptional regulator
MARATPEEAAKTERALRRAGRALFAENGFLGTPAEDIVKAAGLTRGALYHHFAGKEGLFERVLEDVMRELHERLRRAGSRAKDPLSALKAGIHEFLEACSEESNRRLLLIDGPSVLGWARWREMDLKFGLGLLRQALGAAMRAGLIADEPLDVLAHLLAGAMIDGAMLIGTSPGDPKLKRSVEHTLFRLLDGFSGRSGHGSRR